MSPSLGETTPNSQYKWSVCSKEQVQSFLYSSRSHCLVRQRQDAEIIDDTNENVVLGKPISSRSQERKNPDHLPGIAFEPDRQCQLLFDRPDARVCNQPDIDGHSFCQQLWLGHQSRLAN